MKTVRKFFLLVGLVLATGLNYSCTDYQDEIDGLDKRVTKLEEMANTLQKNLDAMAAIVSAMGDNWFIIDYMPIIEDDKTVGYVINLQKDEYDPKTGKVTGSQKKTIEIKDGEKGEDAQFPEIDVKKGKDADGRDVYYWVIIHPDGTEEPITDEDGNPVEVGKDGKDAISPLVRINPTTYMWETSVDGGKNWQSTGVKAEGETGPQGDKGDKGYKGNDADSAIVKVTIVDTPNGKMLEFETASGTTFRLPYIPVS